MVYFGEALMYVTSFFGLFTSIYFLVTLMERKHELKNPVPNIKEWPGVTVIVPAFNEQHTVEKTVRSLVGLDYPRDKLHVIVVDDGSTDDTYKIAKKLESDIVKVYTKENGGKATAMNFALNKTKTDFVGALDADSFVAPDALKKMIGYFNDKRVMAVTPSLKVYSPRTILQKIQMVEYLLGVFLRKIFAFLGSIHVTPGPFTIYRKNFFVKYGGYDENNLTEDIEIALRIQNNHYIIENSVDACVFTVAPRKWNVLLHQRLRWYIGFTENVINYKKIFHPKHGHLGMFILPASFFSVILVIITLFYTIQITVRQNAKSMINMYNVDFDFWQFIKPNTDLFFINFNMLTFIGIVAVLAGIVVIMTAKIISNEKQSIKFPYIFFLMFYWALFGFWWFMAWFYQLSGKKITWGHKSMNDAKASKKPQIV